MLELAGEVGDQVPIGSALAVIETEGADRAAEPVDDSKDERPLADGAVEATPEQAKEIPVVAVEEVGEPPKPARASPRRASNPKSPRRNRHCRRTSSPRPPCAPARAISASISAQVKTAGDRIRHADLDAYLLYNGGSGLRRAARRRARGRDDQGHRPAPQDRREHGGGEAPDPAFHLVEEFDVTALEETRAMLNGDRGSNPKLTLLPFLIVAMSQALAEFPMLNARYDDEANVVTRHGAVHLGMATQTRPG